MMLMGWAPYTAKAYMAERPQAIVSDDTTHSETTTQRLLYSNVSDPSALVNQQMSLTSPNSRQKSKEPAKPLVIGEVASAKGGPETKGSAADSQG
jgi:hypothetical protein